MKTKYTLLAFPVIILILLGINFIYVSTKSIPEQNQLVIGSIGDASFLNPVLSQDSASSQVNSFVFSGLLRYDEKLQLTGDLAESWSVSPGPKPELIFHLRKGIQWHDGHPLTADDVLFTYEMIIDEETNTVRKSDYELVEKVEALDPHTLSVTYKEPFSPALETWTMGIIPRHLLAGTDINTASFNRNPVGTGPFRFDSWVSDEKIVLEANHDYFEGPPHLDRIIFRIIPETSLTEIAILTGGIDYSGVFPHQYERIRKNPNLRVYRQPGLGYTYIGYNLANPLFTDKRVRQALTCAINRKEIVRYVLYGFGQIATGPFPNHLWYADKAIEPFPYDPGKAKELLCEAGWEDTDKDGILDKNGKPFSFRMITNSGNDMRRDVGVLVQRYFKEIGIDADLQIYEWSVFLKNFINPRHFDACILGWGLSVDPDAYSIWHSSQIEGGFNFVGYANPLVDRLLIEGRRTFDLEKRETIYQKIHRLIHEDQPYTFLYVPDSTPALSLKFKREITDADGQRRIVPIEMTEAGLMVNIHEWVVVE